MRKLPTGLSILLLGAFLGFGGWWTLAAGQEKALVQPKPTTALPQDDEMKGRLDPTPKASTLEFTTTPKVSTLEVANRELNPASLTHRQVASEVLQRLSSNELAKLTPKDRQLFENAKQEWARAQTEAAFAHLMKAASIVSVKAAVKSQTEIKSQKDDGSPTAGAIVKYQLSWEREQKKPIRTGKNPTTDTEDFALGRYYIWLQRGGKDTSDRSNLFELVKEHEAITIVER